MKATGERYIPNVNGKRGLGYIQTGYEHLHRYAAAMPFVKNKAVLDLASGEGYGSAYLSEFAASVVGVDVDAETIAHAKTKYGSLKNLTFVEGACDAIPVGDALIDVAVSFETIEHHDKHQEMMQELKRVLRPDGILIISSPNRATYGNELGTKNPYHVRELDFDEFVALLKQHFRSVCVYGQKLAVASLIYPLDPAGVSTLYAFSTQGDDQIYTAMQSLAKPLYFIALCSDAPLEPMSGQLGSVFADSQNDLYLELKLLVKQRMAWMQQLKLGGVYKTLSRLKRSGG